MHTTIACDRHPLVGRRRGMAHRQALRRQRAGDSPTRAFIRAAKRTVLDVNPDADRLALDAWEQAMLNVAADAETFRGDDLPAITWSEIWMSVGVTAARQVSPGGSVPAEVYAASALIEASCDGLDLDPAQPQSLRRAVERGLATCRARGEQRDPSQRPPLREQWRALNAFHRKHLT